MASNTALIRSQQLRYSYVEISKYICSNGRTLSTFSRSATCLHQRERSTGRQRKKSVESISRGPLIGKKYLSHHDGQESVIRTFQHSNVDGSPFAPDWSEFDHLDLNKSEAGRAVSLHGYVTSHRAGRQVDFLTLVDPTLRRSVQVVTPKNALESAMGQAGKLIEPHTPVQIKGALVKAQNPPKKKMADGTTFMYIDQYVGNVKRIGHIDLMAENVTMLNSFPQQLVAKNDTNFPPEMRHLSIRTSSDLRHALKLRSKVKNECFKFFFANGFDDVETPLLFKSTPEGAREFVVPTRRKGLAYALPQSPQQYKQILMASGVHRYFQFAKCFRDEDMRVDRQPEFTQLDLEMSFANSQTVMSTVEQLILHTVWPAVGRSHKLEPSVRQALASSGEESASSMTNLALPVFSYHDVMSKYGSDKPDPRLGAQIIRIEDWVPDSLKKMLTDIEDPIVELIKVTTTHKDPQRTRDTMALFMDLPTSEAYIRNPDGMVGISIYDPSSPLCGLAAFGHEAAAEVDERFSPDEGDILVVMCRPNKAFEGGSTMLGNLRRDLLRYTVEQGLADAPTGDSLLWVTDFPLFSPIEDQNPGQEGEAGICSTHHPFTAPRNDQDLSKLLTDPVSVIGDHYDLVINGVEVGGGSRRVHLPEMQELIFRQVLRMRPDRVEDFRHLLNALGAGCPPHAGFALGFDRLMTLLLDKSSVRDVIAFPKYGDGEDRFVGSPSQLTPSQLSTYHLRVSDEVQSSAESKVSIKA